LERIMPVYSFEDKTPIIDESAFIAPTASIVGEVTIEAGASVWYGATVRGDAAPVIIRAGANVQECAVLHGAPGTVTDIGPGVTVAHLCLVHGAVLEEECLIGNAAIVMDGARVGARSLIGAGSVVSAGMQIPAGVLAIGSPAVVKRELAGTPAADLVAFNPPAYRQMAARHLASIKLVRE
jgi:carbonic anhydrase/acetyltransferase-like protein (isoleucine patch superfamily)